VELDFAAAVVDDVKGEKHGKVNGEADAVYFKKNIIEEDVLLHALQRQERGKIQHFNQSEEEIYW
jgi:hypothetical protein